MANRTIIPVTLITGFLGAGKTTFLNALIRYHRPKRLAIIENEFGEEGIDGELIVDAGNDLFELSNGCICCSLNEDFYSVLENLWQRKDEFDELVIETTGIADPASVASPLLTSPVIPNYYHLQRVICLVDAMNVEEQLKQTVEARQQISFSDVLLITKTDQVAREQLDQVKTVLEGINPFAEVILGNKMHYPFDEILVTERKNIVKKRPKFSLVPVSIHQHQDLVSLSFNFSESFSISILQQRLMAFLIFQAKDVYRVKGIIYSAGNDRKIIVQSVNSNLVIEYGEAWLPDEPKMSRVVFIGKNLQPKGFERMLRQCLQVAS